MMVGSATRVACHAMSRDVDREARQMKECGRVAEGPSRPCPESMPQLVDLILTCVAHRPLFASSRIISRACVWHRIIVHPSMLGVCTPGNWATVLLFSFAS